MKTLQWLVCEFGLTYISVRLWTWWMHATVTELVEDVEDKVFTVCSIMISMFCFISYLITITVYTVLGLDYMTLH